MKRITKVKALLPHNFALLMAASREAELAGRAVVTLDDLLVGLLVTGGSASRVLASHGADLVALRTAVVERDRADLARLGIDGGDLTPQRRTLAETFAVQRGIEASPAVEEVLQSLPSEHELLDALLTHPSGGPAEALGRAGVDVAAVLAHTPWPATGNLSGPRPVPGLLDGQKSATVGLVRFVPVPFERVVEVVSDPAQVALWYWTGEQAEVDATKASLRVRTGRPGHQIVQDCRRLRHDVDADHADIVWQNFWVEPAAEDPRGHYIRLEADRMGSGTQLRITRGINGRGRFAAPARWIGALFSRLAGRNLVHSLAEVAVASGR